MIFSAIKGNFLVVLAAFMFGLSPVLIRFAYQTGITAMTLSACCYGLATVIFTGYFILFKYPFKLPGSVLLKVLLVGVFLRGGMNVCFFISYQYIQASLGELIFYLYPALTLIIAYFYLKESFTLLQALAVIISFGGCFLILHVPFSNANWLGIMLMVLAAIANAFYLNLSSVFLKTISPLALSYYSGIGCCFTFIVAGLFSHTLTWGVSVSNIAFIVAIAIGIVLAMVLFLSGISLIGAGKSALLCTFEPVATILFSAILLHERLSLVQMLGGLLVLLSALISVRPQKQEEKKTIDAA